MRVKRGTTKKQKHKKVLKQAKGYHATYHQSYRRAREALLHAGQYSYIHRRHRRGQMRKSWIKIIAAALFNSDITYKQLIHGMKQNNIELNRKVLAEIAQTNPEHFQVLIEQVK